MHWKPRQWTLVSVLLAILLTMQPVAMAQVTTTEIADTVYRADGTPATGTVVLSWPEFMTATGQSVPAGSTSVTIGANGALDVQLAPNAGSNPMGSYYTAVYHLDDGSVSRQYWVVPASGSPVKINAISSTVMPLSVAQQTVTKSYVDTSIAQAVAGVSPNDTTAPYVLKSGDTMTGPLVLPGDPTAATQAADKHYVDTSVQQLTGGLAQKVSTLPQTTQTIAQPAGTQLGVNRVNGVEYASQYASPQGGDGIANAAASADCANGCDIDVEDTYASGEGFDPGQWQRQTHVEDDREGQKGDNYLDPAVSTGYSRAQTISLVNTENPGAHDGAVLSGTPTTSTLDLFDTARAGGSNQFPNSFTPTPYFKSTYFVQQSTGTYNTMGQHLVSGRTINCFSVGDCLIGSQTINYSGGFRDEGDEGAHAFDLDYVEDPRVFTGTCSSGCTAGSTSVNIASNNQAASGTQGDGRFLIDTNPTKIINTGSLIGGNGSAVFPVANFTGTSFPVSVFFSLTAIAPPQSNNIAPGTVTLPIATSNAPAGFATNTAAAPAPSGLACIADLEPDGSVTPSNYEMVGYTVVDGTHLKLTLNKVHNAQAVVSIGGLCGYGLEETVDTSQGIRQVFPVVGSLSATGLYYASHATPIVGRMNLTGGFANVSSTIVSVTRNNNVVTLTAAGNFPQDINGLTMTVAGVADSSYNGSFSVATTGSNTLTYAQNGPNSTSTGGTLTYLTGGFALYPMAEVLSVMDPANKQVDGLMTLAPNTVSWAQGDTVEEPHYFEEYLSVDQSHYTQVTPPPSFIGGGGIAFRGTMPTAGMLGWDIQNQAPTTSYFGGGGTHQPPFAAFGAHGVWNSTMDLTAGIKSIFAVHCNMHGCGNWNSAYDLFEMDRSVGGYDFVRYDPAINYFFISTGGNLYQFTPQGFQANTINVGTLNATTINGQVSASSITSGAVAAAYLPKLGASGSAHAAGIVPDPGATPGTSRYLREDGTWSVPADASSAAPAAGMAAGASADYSFLDGTGTAASDSTGNGNTAAFGAAPPTWGTAGLRFVPGQGLSLPASLNNTRTFFLALHLDPLTSGPQPYANQYGALISSSMGPSGFNFLAAEDVPNGYISSAYAPSLYVNSTPSTASQVLISGFHVLAVTLGTGAGDPDRLYIDGVEVGSYTRQNASAGTQTGGNFYLGSSGASPWGLSGIQGTVYRLRTYPAELSAADIQQTSGAIRMEVASRNVPTAPPVIPVGAPRLHAIGDSITFGQGVATPWPSLLSLSSLPSTYPVTDWGISGIAVASLAASESNRVATYCKPSNGDSIAIVFAGTNDFQFTLTPEQVFQSLLDETRTLKRAGCKVFLGTMISRTGGNGSGGSMDSSKDGYDALILQQGRSFGADGIIDFAANPLLGADGAYADSMFQADQTHPTEAGQQLLANEASNALNFYFGYNESNPHTVTTPNYGMTAGDGYVSLSGLTGASTMTLPDCLGQSGATYRINNPQSAFAVSVVPLNAGEPINGLTTVTVPANGTLTLRDVPNPKTTAGCHWEM